MTRRQNLDEKQRSRFCSQIATMMPPSLAYMVLTPPVFTSTTSRTFIFFRRASFTFCARSRQLQCEMASIRCSLSFTCSVMKFHHPLQCFAVYPAPGSADRFLPLPVAPNDRAYLQGRCHAAPSDYRAFRFCAKTSRFSRTKKVFLPRIYRSVSFTVSQEIHPSFFTFQKMRCRQCFSDGGGTGIKDMNLQFRLLLPQPFPFPAWRCYRSRSKWPDRVTT